MKFIFLDETTGRRGTNLYGVCGVSIDDKHYASLARAITRCFSEANWDPNIEFKGRWLFSATKGDTSVDVDKRIELAATMIRLNVAQKNAKLKIVFTWNNAGEGAENHLSLTSKLLQALLPAIKPGRKGKPCIVFHDRTDKIPEQDLWASINGTLSSKNYHLVEDVNMIREWKATQIGLCLCDLIAYLAAWHCSTANAKEAQMRLFDEEQISPHDVRKAETVETIFQNLKNIRIIEAN
jgi:hypothetical protein